MPYVGRLPALFLGKPVMIVGWDPTHALCVDWEGRFRYIEHNALEIPWQGDAEALYWMEYGYAVDPDVATGDDPDASPDDDSSDSR